ncbi:conserved hypothetical protein [Vibrio harveyi]|uniref:hypothetical protein n=1 Tax=Vibrio harveyi TaxID=669 RepID=UPI002894DD9B|nr:conserved hypothetical protein [Vibrio harveyi]
MYNVIISFRRNSDYSNELKNVLISKLGGPYKVTQEALNDMQRMKPHYFEFPSKEVAARFANSVFSTHNDVFDIQTDFTL